MYTEITLSRYNITSKPCFYNKKKKKIEKLDAVNLQNSLFLKIKKINNKLVIYNEKKYGFYINIQDLKNFYNKYHVRENSFEEFLLNIKENFSNTISKKIREQQ